jgi:hypothetical protein
MLAVLLSIVLTGAAVSVFLVRIGEPAYIVPLIAVLFSFFFNILGSSTYTPEYYTVGAWWLGAGLFSIFFRFPVLVQIGYIFGVGFFIFAVTAFLRHGKRPAPGAA